MKLEAKRVTIVTLLKNKSPPIGELVSFFLPAIANWQKTYTFDWLLP